MKHGFSKFALPFCSSDSGLLAAFLLSLHHGQVRASSPTCPQIIRPVQDVRGAENDVRFPLLARIARRYACELDRGAESMSAKVRIAVIAGTPTSHFDVGDEASPLHSHSGCFRLLQKSSQVRLFTLRFRRRSAVCVERPFFVHTLF